MTSRNWQRWALAFVLLGGAACTDKRPRGEFYVEREDPPAFQSIHAVAEVQFGGQVTLAQKMQVNAGSLYLTGKPFALSRWDVSADPERPELVFAASDTMLNEFAPPDRFGPWRPDDLASGALAILGGHALMSGTLGMSVVNISNTHRPVESRRFPVWQNDQPASDPKFIYRGLVATSSGVYGFRSQDYAVSLSPSLPGVSVRGSIPYPSGNSCCVRSAAAFAGRIFVAMGTRLHIYQPSASGGLSFVKSVDSLQAVNVYATSQFLYVHHRTISSIPYAGRPSGIYAINANGKVMNFFAVNPLEFAVHNEDSHIYANRNNQSITVFRLSWPSSSSLQ